MDWREIEEAAAPALVGDSLYGGISARGAGVRGLGEYLRAGVGEYRGAGA